MTTEQYLEVEMLHRALVAAQKRIDDALASVSRIQDELLEANKAIMILRNLPINPPRAEDMALWRLPNGPMA